MEFTDKELMEMSFQEPAETVRSLDMVVAKDENNL